MILESVEHGPLIWPTIEENGVTRTKKYVELSVVEKIQADCDMKATNIILKVLPADIYSLERECKLYDAFDKFTHIKGETLYKYYLRFTQLINDMNIYKMKMEQFQVNTKFLNSLLPKWSLVVPVFSPGDDPIACLNTSMAFLTAVASSRTKLLGNALILNNPRNAAWLIRIKQCLAEAQKQDQILNRRATSHIPCRSKTEDLDTYYSDCDDISNAKAVLMANIFNYGFDVISEVPPAETYLNDIENQSVHAMQDFEQTPVVMLQ
ncbi:hypothetical protein Tco_0721734 [Tanacetum coccineum]